MMKKTIEINNIYIFFRFIIIKFILIKKDLFCSLYVQNQIHK